MNKKQKVLDIIIPAFFVIYAMRNITVGLDLWDTGYNYSNFLFFDLEHMDSMWFFSTYLASAIGHIFTLLPYGHTLVGLNFYTGLVTGLMCLASYYFCVKKVKMGRLPVFLGLFLAESLCWCPTAKQYDYLTFLFMLLCIISLYKGLMDRKRVWLVVAGMVLGLNLFVRFSNLPEIMLIVAVWYYDFLGIGKLTEKLKRAAFDTLFCVIGYGITLACMLVFFVLAYGAGNYIDSVSRLFGMSGQADGYSFYDMLHGQYVVYRMQVYWLVRMAVFAIGGWAAYLLTYFLMKRFVSKGKPLTKMQKIPGFGLVLVAMGLMLAWLYQKHYCSLLIRTYDAIFYPGSLMLIIALVVGFMCVVSIRQTKESRFLGMVTLIVVFVTALGSNNGLFPSMNNLFLVAPFVFWKVFSVIGPRLPGRDAIKVEIACLLAFILFQCGAFGTAFTFVEATGAKDVGSVEESRTGIPSLQGARMSASKAEMMKEVYSFFEEHSLLERELLPFGNVPGFSFYFEMAPAFNSWSDLASYETAYFEENIEALREKPVILLARENVRRKLETGKEEALGKKLEILERYIAEEEYQVWKVEGEYSYEIYY